MIRTSSGDAIYTEDEDATKPTNIEQLPRSHFLVVVTGACFLSINGGFVNGMCMAGIFKLGLTHLTGTTTTAAISMFIPSQHEWWYYWLLIVTYALGAALCGLILGTGRTKFRGRQAIVLLLETIALWLAYLITSQGSLKVAPCFITFACGLQNASTSAMAMVVIRTTNVTGTVVDIGMAFALCLSQGFAKHGWRLALWLPCFLGFWLGAALGTLGFQHQGVNIMAVPATISTVFTALVALRYCVLKDHIKVSDNLRERLIFQVC